VRNSIRADLPADEVFIAAGTLAESSQAVPVVWIFGRERYKNSYYHWYLS
jgi:hypothetical protein